MKIKILLADDNHLFRELLAARIALTEEFEVIAEAGNGEELLEKIRYAKPDILLMEPVLPGMAGTEMVRSISVMHPETRVIALTSRNEKKMLKEMLEAKAMGYILKDCSFDQLLDSIKQVHSGKKYLSADVQSILIDDYLERAANKDGALTSREMEILKLLADGKSIKEISETLFISIKTTGTHKQHIFDKLQFENMAQLIKYTMNNGIIS